MRISRCHFLPIHHRRQEIVSNRCAILGAKRNQQLKIRICCVMDSLSNPIRTKCLSQSLPLDRVSSPNRDGIEIARTLLVDISFFNQ